VIDVPFIQQVGWVAVIGAEATAAAVLRCDSREQIDQVTRPRRLTDKKVHPQTQPILRLFFIGALVVGSDTGSDVGVKPRPADARAMTVHDATGIGFHFGQDPGVAQDKAGEVHHFGQTQYARVIEKSA